MKGIRKSYSDLKMIDLYRGKELSESELDKIVASTVRLLNKGEEVHYNDEHGVGSFRKSQEGKPYLATHHRHFIETKEPMDKDDIKNFLRNFFDLGYRYEKHDEWER